MKNRKLKPWLKFIVPAAIVLLLFFVFLLKSSGEDNDPLSVAVADHPLNVDQRYLSQPLLKDEVMSGSFTAKLNNLGIVALRFTYPDQHGDQIVFRIKEKNKSDWHYESTYSARLIPRDRLFPFGFQPFIDSKGKEYIFEIQSLKGSAADSLKISNIKPQLVSKYQFSPKELVKSGQLPEFLITKLFGNVNVSGFLIPIGAVVLFLAAVFLGRKFPPAPHLKNPKIQIAIIAVVSLLTAYYLVGQNLKASFGVIDDHWIAYFLGPDKKATFSEFPKLLLSTEVGKFGNYERFRPAYYPLLIVESILWGNNPYLWYLSRLILFSASIAISWYILKRFFGSLLSLTMVLFVLTYGYWGDIWTRLIPGEIFAVFGTSLFALGFAHLFFWPKTKSKILNSRDKIFVAVMTLGYLIAAGSKENMLLLFVPLAYLYYKNKKLRINLFGLIAGVICLFYSGLIATAIGLSVLKSGKDVYSQELSASGRADFISQGLELFINKFKIFYAGLTVVILGFFVFASENKNKINQFIALAKKYFWGLILSALFFISQYVFYSGQWPQNNRYDFPGMLAEPFIIFFSVFIYFQIFSLIYKAKADTKVLKLVAAAILVLLIGVRGFSEIRDKSNINKVTTNLFEKNLSAIIDNLKENPNKPMVVESYSFWDYEPVYGLNRYLSASSIPNKKFLRIHGYTEASGSSALEKRLSAELSAYSKGKSQDSDFQFEPLNTLENEQNCVSIVLSVRSGLESVCSEVNFL